MADVSSTPAPPEGLSKTHLMDLTLARDALARADVVNHHTVSAEHLREVLAAYDILAARHAWLAAEHATMKMGGA